MEQVTAFTWGVFPYICLAVMLVDDRAREPSHRARSRQGEQVAN